MVHKSGHHFDLVNWWIDAAPSEVAGMGRLAFYGDENGKRHGWARDYTRAQGSEEAKQDPFAIHIKGDESLSKLYGPDAHKVDGYERDRNVRGLLWTLIKAEYLSRLILTTVFPTRNQYRG
jgi:hypothetical protein